MQGYRTSHDFRLDILRHIQACQKIQDEGLDNFLRLNVTLAKLCVKSDRTAAHLSIANVDAICDYLEKLC